MCGYIYTKWTYFSCLFLIFDIAMKKKNIIFWLRVRFVVPSQFVTWGTLVLYLYPLDTRKELDSMISYLLLTINQRTVSTRNRIRLSCFLSRYVYLSNLLACLSKRLDLGTNHSCMKNVMFPKSLSIQSYNFVSPFYNQRHNCMIIGLQTMFFRVW